MKKRQKLDPQLVKEFETELKKAEKFKLDKLVLSTKKYKGVEKFFEIYLSEKLPQGVNDLVFDKHLALWLAQNQNNVNLAEIKERYTTLGRDWNRILNWLKKVNVGEITDYNLGELINASRQIGRKDLEKLFREISRDAEKELPVIYDKDFKNLKIEKVEWLIEDILPRGTICFLIGKRGTFKSFTSTYLAYCLAEGKSLFDRFSISKKSKILFIDEESNLSLIKERKNMIKRGLGIKKNSDVAFLSLASIRIDNPLWVEKLENFIQEFEPDVIIVDSLRRVVKFKENEAEPVSELFTDTLKPLSKKYGVTWILLHHMRKGITGKNPYDEMDEMRGSSDLPALADVILGLHRNRGSTDSVIFKQLKCRYKQEIRPKIVRLNWEQDNLKMTCMGDAEDTIYADEVCAKLILRWMAENELTVFKTWEAIKQMKEQKQTRPTTERALKVLLEQGKLIKPQRGIYELNVNVDLNEFVKPSNPQNHQDGNKALEVNKESFTSKYNKKEGLMEKNKKNEPSKEPSLYMLEGFEGSDVK
ncbi:MAG: AAA family ATPase [Candidatus Thorarchaeota archaeon]|jgi:archaellum biogenesis ATPase FlaH